MPTTYKKIGNIKTSIRIKGKGFPILILHGWGASLESWREVQDNLAEEGFEVFCPDLPGFGNSQDLFKAWDLDDYCEWVVEFCDYFNLDRVYIIAHSFGGRITIKLNQTPFKKRIKKNILVSPAGVRLNLNKKQKLLSFITKIGNFIFSVFEFKKAKRFSRKLFYSLIPSIDYTKASPIMQDTMRKIIEEDLTSALSDVEKETILIWGEKDKMVPLETSDVFTENIKDTKTIIIPEEGHSPHLNIPDRLTKIMLKHL